MVARTAWMTMTSPVSQAGRQPVDEGVWSVEGTVMDYQWPSQGFSIMVCKHVK